MSESLTTAEYLSILAKKSAVKKGTGIYSEESLNIFIMFLENSLFWLRTTIFKTCITVSSVR
jgi:hypothetical protein